MSEKTRGGKHAYDTDAQFNYQDYLDPSFDDCAVIITTERGVQFLTSLIRSLFYYNTRWTDDGAHIRDTGAYPTVSKWVTQLERDLFMACDITEGLNNLIVSVQQINLSLQQSVLVGSGGCGCGSKGAGGTDPPASSVDTGDIYDEELDPPEGFETREDYVNYKCKVAQWIVDATLKDAQWLQNLDTAAITVSGLTSGLLFVIPGVNIVALIFFLTVTLVVAGYLATVLSDWENTILAAYDDLVCAAYEASTVSQAITDYEAVTNTYIELQTSDPIAIAFLKTLAVSWRNNAAFNKLFVKDAALNLDTFSGDCSSCAPPTECTSTWTFPTDTSGWAFTDESTDAEADAFGNWDAGEQLKVRLVVSYPPGNKTAWGAWEIDLSGLDVNAHTDDVLSVDISSAAFASLRRIGLVIDGVFEYTDNVSAAAVTVNHTVVTSGNIDKVRLLFGLSTGPFGPAVDLTQYVTQVQLALSDTNDCPEGDV